MEFQNSKFSGVWDVLMSQLSFNVMLALLPVEIKTCVPA
jgi:hypothetical protein